MLQPLAQRQFLAPLPGHEPRYKVPVQYGLADGGTRTVQASCPRALRALLALMDMGALMGGAACHFGGPSALAELASAMALCLQQATHQDATHQDALPSDDVEHYDKFHIINDAGHCENIFYALRANLAWGVGFEDLKLFRSILSPLTGHGEAGLFPQGVYLSNGPLGSALPQAQGLAMADKLQGLDRTTICFVSDGACMEGEAREALAALPGLAAQNKLNPFLLILSDNEKKLSGPMSEAFSMQPSFEALAPLGWQVEKLNEAHNLQACVHKLQHVLASLNSQQPCVLWAKTTKGYGVASAAQSPSGGHGFSLKKPEELNELLEELYTPDPVPEEFLKWQQSLVQQASQQKAGSPVTTSPVTTSLAKTPPEKIQKGITRALLAAAHKYPVVSVSSDLAGSTGTAPFAKEFPERSFDVGVAEANMFSVGAGLSKQGFIPVVDTFAQFAVTKGVLPLTMANLSQAPVIAVLSHVGFQDAADGASHQALAYYAAVSALPKVQVFSLTCSSEAEALLTQAIDEFALAKKNNKTPSSYVFFLGREKFAPSYQNKPPNYRLRRAQVLWDNTNAHKALCTIAAAGSLLPEALKAAHILQQQACACVVVNPSCINLPDTNCFIEVLEKTHFNLITLEEHQVIAGMGAMLVHALVQKGVPLQARSLGVKGEFGQSAYTAHDLYVHHGLDASALVEAAQAFGREK